MTTQPNTQFRLWQASMILAPVLISIAQFYWNDGMLTATAGWIQVFAFTFWILAFQGMFHLTREKYPAYSAIGFAIAAWACVGGAGFGYDGIYVNAMGISSIAEAHQMHDEVGTPLILSMYLPGILFPLSLLVLAVQLIRSGAVSTFIGLLLILAAVGFPLSRMPRIDWIAHADNVLLILSHVMVAMSASFKR